MGAPLLWRKISEGKGGREGGRERERGRDGKGREGGEEEIGKEKG